MELVKYLFTKSHSDVILEKFTTDQLERESGKLRQGSGGTYFTNIQQLWEKFNLSKAKLMLRCEMTFDSKNGHFCEECHYSLSEEQYKILDSLP